MLFTFFIHSILAHGTSYDERCVFAYFSLLQKILAFSKFFRYIKTLNQVNFIAGQLRCRITVKIFDQGLVHHSKASMNRRFCYLRFNRLKDHSRYKKTRNERIWKNLSRAYYDTIVKQNGQCLFANRKLKVCWIENR